MMDPNPTLGAARRCLCELGCDPGAHERSVPPRTGGEERIVNYEGFAVRQDSLLPRSADPLCDPLAGLILDVEIVIAGADHECGLGPQAAEIFSNDHALRATVDQRREVEMVARHHNRIEAVGNVENPVELRQRIVQIGYQK
jgi:hypothetical protein